MKWFLLLLALLLVDVCQISDVTAAKDTDGDGIPDDEDDDDDNDGIPDDEDPDDDNDGVLDEDEDDDEHDEL